MSAVLTTSPSRAASPFDQLINPAPPRVAPPEKDLVVMERRIERAQHRADGEAATKPRKLRSDSGRSRELLETVPPAVPKSPFDVVRPQVPHTIPDHLLGISPQRLQQLLDIEASVKKTLDLCPGAVRIRRHDGEDVCDSLNRTFNGMLAKMQDRAQQGAGEPCLGSPAERDAHAVEGFLPHLKAQAQILSRRGLKGWSDRGKLHDPTLARELIDAVQTGDYAQVAFRAMVLHTRAASSSLLTSAIDSAKKAYVNELRESCGRHVPGNAAPLKGSISISGDTVFCDEVPILRWCGRVLKSEILTWVARTLDGERLVPINHAGVYGDMRHSMLLLSHAAKGFEHARWGSASGQYRVWLGRLQEAVKRVDVDLLLDAYSRETRSVTTLRYPQYTPLVSRLIDALRSVDLMEAPEAISLSEWQAQVTPAVVAVDEALSDIDWIAI